MTKFLLSFASSEFLPSQKRLEVSAQRHGIDIVISKTPDDLRDSEFVKRNEAIFRYRRGFGYWLWKPFFIVEALKRMDENDLLVYCDSGAELIAPLDPLFEIATQRQPFVGFGVHGHRNRVWTKRDCFVGLDCDAPKFWDAEQWNGFMQVYRKTDKVMEFVDEFLAKSQDARLITDEPNQLGQPNLPEFRDHRHDQSILSLLSEKAGWEKFRDPSQWGNFLKIPEVRVEGEFQEHPYSASPMTNSKYGSLVNHHRERLSRS